MSNNNIILCSGGIHSTALLVAMVKSGIKFQVLHVNYGQSSFFGSLATVKHFCNKYGLFYHITREELIEKAIKNFDRSKIKDKILFGSIVSAVSYLSPSNIYVGISEEEANTEKGSYIQDIKKLVLDILGVNIILISSDISQLFYDSYKQDTNIFDRSFGCEVPIGNNRMVVECMRCYSCREKVKYLQVVREMKKREEELVCAE